MGQTPVIRKDLEGGVIAEANNDGTIYVDKDVKKGSALEREAIAHEKVHLNQMKRGDLNYDDCYVYWKGKAYLASIYAGNTDMHPEKSKIEKVRSVTIFQKSEFEYNQEYKGVVLYQCLDYLASNECKYGIFPPEPSISLGKIREENLKIYDLAENARSIKFDPEDSYFAVLFSENNFTGDVCEVITANDNNLLDRPIGRCGLSCKVVAPMNDLLGRYAGKYGQWLESKTCYPCLKSMLIIKGKVIGY